MYLTDRSCGIGRRCVSASECTNYQKYQTVLKNLKKAKAFRARSSLITRLRSFICNKSERKVCCRNVKSGSSSTTNTITVANLNSRARERSQISVPRFRTWPGKWPHMCALLQKVNTSSIDGDDGDPVTVYVCGASLIEPGVLLTSANCVSDDDVLIDTLTVRCGEWDTENEDEPNPFQERNVEKIVKHPDYDDNNQKNGFDFALVFTSNNFTLVENHIMTMRVPKSRWGIDHSSCVATGWGQGRSGEYQTVLREVDLTIVDRDACQESFQQLALNNDREAQNTTTRPESELYNSFLCASEKAGQEMCMGKGNYGSPLVCPLTDWWSEAYRKKFPYWQVGIVSWENGCNDNNVPGVYADVSKATCWIDQEPTCHYGAQTGDYSSHFGYEDSTECSNWQSNKITELTQKMEKAENNQTYYQNIINQYSKCDVVYYEYQSLLDLH